MASQTGYYWKNSSPDDLGHDSSAQGEGGSNQTPERQYPEVQRDSEKGDSEE